MNVKLKITRKTAGWLAGILIVLALAGAVVYEIYREKELPVHPEVTHAIIYADTSSFPTFLQLVDLIKQDVQTPKMIFWRRLTSLPTQDPLFQHALVVKPSASFKVDKDRKKLRRQIQRFIRAYPNAKFTLHLNKDQNALVWAFLTAIPRNRVQHIHWYEESFGATSFQIGYLRLPEKYALPILDRKVPPPHFGINYMLSLLPFYPSTIHMGLRDVVLQTHPEIKKAYQSAGRIENVDYLEIARSLTAQQKADLLRLAGVREEDLALFKQGKPVLLYTLGYFANDRKFNNKQIRILERLMNREIGASLESFENYTWLFKEHPWLSKDKFLHKTILKKWPFMHPLPKQIPLEVLFLTGYMPDKVFGYSSSLFFALPADRILFYIQRPNDVYVPLLKKSGILTDDKIISFEEDHVSK